MTSDLATLVALAARVLGRPDIPRDFEGGGTVGDGLDRLSEQLHWLSKNVPGPDGSVMTVADLSRWAERLTGVKVSEPYINAMRQGRQRNPSAQKLGAIAAVYSVPTDFFLRPEIEQQIRLLMKQLAQTRRDEAEELLRRVSAASQQPLRAPGRPLDE